MDENDLDFALSAVFRCWKRTQMTGLEWKYTLTTGLKWKLQLVWNGIEH